jgi:osmotically-inducible protein OsmY
MKSRNIKRGVFAAGSLLAVAIANVHADTNEAEEAYNEAKAETQEAWNTSKDKAKHAQYEVSTATHNAWLHGKLETTFLLNSHLNNFAINSQVKNGTATLDGVVESGIDKDLAEEVALSINGIDKVENNLRVDAASAKANAPKTDKSWGQTIDDATITASVKSKLLLNEHTKGLSINVDTDNDVVTLRGDVDSSEEKSLAGQVASNTDEVKSVVNELRVSADQG